MKWFLALFVFEKIYHRELITRLSILALLHFKLKVELFLERYIQYEKAKKNWFHNLGSQLIRRIYSIVLALQSPGQGSTLRPSPHLLPTRFAVQSPLIVETPG